MQKLYNLSSKLQCTYSRVLWGGDQLVQDWRLSLSSWRSNITRWVNHGVSGQSHQWEMFQVKTVHKIRSHRLCFKKIVKFMRQCWKNKHVGNRMATDENRIRRRKHAIFASDKETTQTHTQNMYYLLLLYGDNRHANALRCYVIHLLPVLFDWFLLIDWLVDWLIYLYSICIHLFTYLLICLFIRSFIYLFTHLFTYLFIYLLQLGSWSHSPDAPRP
jgi:hypothetical protein